MGTVKKAFSPTLPLSLLTEKELLPDVEKLTNRNRTPFNLRLVMNLCRSLPLFFPEAAGLRSQWALWFHTKTFFCYGQHAWPHVLQNPGEIHATSFSGSRAECNEKGNSKMVATDKGFLRYVWKRGTNEVKGMRIFLTVLFLLIFLLLC